MGIFDKFSKKKKKDEESESVVEKVEKEVAEQSEAEENTEKEAPKAETKEETTAVEDIKSEKATEAPKAGGRFTIMIENMLQLENNMGVEAVGNVHGTVNAHDKVYLMHPALPEPICTEIDSIEIGPDETADTATDRKVVVKISSIKDRNTIPKFTVITNVRPHNEVNANQPLENPFLLGLTYEYPRFSKDRGFYNIITFAIFSSRFITPIKVDDVLDKRPDGTALMKKNTKVGFKMLKHPQNESMIVLPVFTDWATLKNWKDAFDKDDQPKTMLMSFDQCAEIGVKSKGGFVINPYGPVPFYVNNEIISSIYKMKAEMDEKIAQAQKNGGNPFEKKPN